MFITPCKVLVSLQKYSVSKVDKEPLIKYILAIWSTFGRLWSIFARIFLLFWELRMNILKNSTDSVSKSQLLKCVATKLGQKVTFRKIGDYKYIPTTPKIGLVTERMRGMYTKIEIYM